MIFQTLYIIIFFVPCHLLCLYVLWIKVSLPITYLGLKVIRQVLNYFRIISDMIIVRFDRPT